MDYWIRSLDGEYPVDVIYLDVLHNHLFEAYGIHGNLFQWFQFLTNIIVLNGCCSNWSADSSRVPQSSVLEHKMYMLPFSLPFSYYPFDRVILISTVHNNT